MRQACSKIADQPLEMNRGWRRGLLHHCRLSRLLDYRFMDVPRMPVTIFLYFH